MTFVSSDGDDDDRNVGNNIKKKEMLSFTFTDWGCSGLKDVKGEGVGAEGTWI